jgi:esterase, PHB depolymerase family
MVELILAGLMMSNVGPARASISPSADTAGGESFVWDKYDGPEGSRRYKLYVPAATPGPTRLLVMLHGCTQDPDDFALGTRMNQVAEEKGFIVLYPEQPATANPLKCWNWYAAAHQKRAAGEPALLAAMIRKVVAEQKVDPAKVYAAGISAGGAMTAILGATYPELVAAMAIHSGIAYGLATEMSQALMAMRAPRGDAAALGDAVLKAMGERKKIVPVFIVQGRIDPSVNVANARLLADQWLLVNGPTTVPPAMVTTETQYGGVRCVYRAESGRPIVETWIISGLAHAWSGGSKEGTFTDDKGPDASRAIVEFFLESEKSNR